MMSVRTYQGLTAAAPSILKRRKKEPRRKTIMNRQRPRDFTRERAKALLVLLIGRLLGPGGRLVNHNLKGGHGGSERSAASLMTMVAAG